MKVGRLGLHVAQVKNRWQQADRKPHLHAPPIQAPPGSRKDLLSFQQAV
jgi:hypothetical protein